MSWFVFAALCFAGLIVIAGIGLFFVIVTFKTGNLRNDALRRAQWDDGPPEPPPGDMPNVPPGAVGPK